MHNTPRKATNIATTLIMIALIFGFLTWQDMKNKQEHQDIVAGFTKMDTYGPFPLSSIATDNRNIYEVDDFIQENRLTYTVYYYSENPDQELKAYREYLVAQGYNDVTPTAKPNNLDSIYQVQSDLYKRLLKIEIFLTQKGYMLQFSGF